MKLRFVAALVAATVSAGCSGGGGGSSAAPVIAPTSAAAPQAVNATVTFTIPPAQKSTSALAPKFISTGATTFVATINSYNATLPANFPSWLVKTTTVALTSSNCTGFGPSRPAATKSPPSCTVTFPTYPGIVNYTFELQDSNSDVLAEFTDDFHIAQGKTNTLNFVFRGVPASIDLSSVSLDSHLKSSVLVPYQVLDASGDVITFSPFSTPITFSITGESKAALVSKAASLQLYAGGTPSDTVTVTGARVPVKLNYSGLAIAPFTITASATGVTPVSVTVSPTINAVLFPSAPLDEQSSSDPNYEMPTVYINSFTSSASFKALQIGWSNPPYSKGFVAALDPATCSGVATISTTDNVEFLVTPAGTTAGICKITVTGGGGASNVIYAAITSTSIGVNGRHH